MPTPLLPFSTFDPVFADLADRRVHFVEQVGSVGDDLINAATYQMFAHYGVRLTHRPEEAETVVWAGGGNLGNLYAREFHRRHSALMKAQEIGLPFVVLPQSVTSSMECEMELLHYSRVIIWLRERNSLRLVANGRLGPDLALAYLVTRGFAAPAFSYGLFLRTDREGCSIDPNSLGDPIRMVPRSVPAYLGLAARYAHIETDRLHFAIAGLLLGRQVTLRPNRTGKNRAMFETWLEALGCYWKEG